VRPVIQEASEQDIDVHVPWPDDVYLPRRRRRLGMWLVTAFLLPSVALLGWVAEKQYHLVARVQQRAAPPAAIDPRAPTLIAEGEGAIAEGDLDGAQSDLDKASVLTNGDLRVLVGEARVAAAKADIPWLKMRLLPPGAAEELRVTRAELDQRVATARRTADDALSVAPQDPSAVRAKLDALRLGGDSQTARGLVVAVFAQASEAETAYVLAALDLADPASPWPTIVDRLRAAAEAERGGGRARAALVYALARSGDVAGARAELAKLDAQPRPYPLLPLLHAWLGLDGKAAPAAMPAESPAASAAPSSPEAPGQAPAPAATAITTPPAGEPIRAALPTTLQAASQAINRGEFERAERIYQGIIATDPNDSQALTGLGDVLRLRSDPWGAIEAYQRAIKINPSYLPAQLGLADTQWGRGDQAGAARTYKHIVDHFPDGMYPQYVAQRAGPVGP
jgi:tetratricopeptide (TPR) repeat protein